MAVLSADDFREAFRQAASLVRKGDRMVELLIDPSKGVSFRSGERKEAFNRTVKCVARGPATRLSIWTGSIAKWLTQTRKSDWLGFACNDRHQPAAFICSERPMANWIVAGQRKEIEQPPPQPAVTRDKRKRELSGQSA
jgi:hypothetical protein